jgi:hypothetical protein
MGGKEHNTSTYFDLTVNATLALAQLILSASTIRKNQ